MRVRHALVLVAMAATLLELGGSSGRAVPVAAIDAVHSSPQAPRGLPEFSARSTLQPHPQGLDLVLEGGGAKGLAYAGAIGELEAQRIRYRRIAATSAGALFALYIAAGYSAAEIRAMITERMPDGSIIMGSFLVVPEEFSEEVIRSSLAFSVLDDLHFPEKMNLEFLGILLKLKSFREAFSLLEFGGLVAGDAYIEWMRHHLDRGGRNLGDATLAEFHERTGADITMVAADVDSDAMLILNHRTAPTLPVVWAVRMSSSVPVAFRNVLWRPQWGTYLGGDLSGHRIVDGGVASNLPILLLLADSDSMVSAMGAVPDPARVLAFMLDEHAAVPGLQTLLEAAPQRAASAVDRHWNAALGSANSLIEALIESQDNFIASQFPTAVCRLASQGFTALQYDLSEQQVELLVAAAARSTTACIRQMPRAVIAAARSE